MSAERARRRCRPTLVDRNNPQPVAKTLRHGQPVEMLKRLEKGFLRQVLGQVKVAQHTHTYPVHGLLIPLHQGIKGGAIALQCVCDEFGITVVRHKSPVLLVTDARISWLSPPGRNRRPFIKEMR
jgi:hypothetical protein